MKRSSLFGHVIELHDAIRRSKRPADVIVQEFFRSRHYLGANDRRFVSDLLYSLVRHFKLLLVYSEECVKLQMGVPYPKTIPSIVLIATYCVKTLDEEAGTILPDVSGLWRVYVPEMDCETFLKALPSVTLPLPVEQDATRSIATRFSFPETIIQEWIDRFGLEETEQICLSLNSSAPTTIRVNTLAAKVVECKAALLGEGIETQQALLSPVGLKLSKRVNVQALTTFKRGYFEMQDEGSQLLSMLVQPLPGMTVVDACAGGGGKTLHLAALMKNAGTLIAIDVEIQRLKNIQERLRRAGVTIVRTYLASRDHVAIEDLGEKADAVLIDAPCSGAGTFRRNPAAKLTFTEAFVESSARTQSEVLEKYSTLVKSGGRLVYSTCTLVRKENEDQVSAFLDQHSDFKLLSAPEILIEQGVRVDSGSLFLTLLPHKTTTDGFFAAVMARR